MWDAHDEATKSKVVVLGATVARTSSGARIPSAGPSASGAIRTASSVSSRAKGQAPFGDQDDQVLMPIGSYRARISRVPPGFAGVLMASASSPETSDRAVRQIDVHPAPAPPHRRTGTTPTSPIHSQKEIAELQDTMYGIITDAPRLRWRRSA
jgi:putative ABC transport system permease protein